MDLYGMDETKEPGPELMLTGKALELAKVKNAKVGQVFELKADAVVKSVSSSVGPDGTPMNCLCLELSRIELEAEEDEQETMNSMYPKMVAQQAQPVMPMAKS